MIKSSIIKVSMLLSVVCVLFIGLYFTSCNDSEKTINSDEKGIEEVAKIDSVTQDYTFIEYENGKMVVDLDKVPLFADNPLPIWFPLLIGGLFLLISGTMYFTRRKRYVGLGVRNVVLGVLLMLFYLLEIMFFLFKKDGGSIAYYMEPNTVGWFFAILGIVLTIIICFAQWIVSGMYMLSTHRLHLSFYSFLISNLICTLSLFLYTLGVAKTFLSKYLLLIMFVVSLIHIIIMIINNIKEGTGRMLLIEIPLYLICLPATMLSLILFIMAVAIVLAVYFVKKVYVAMTGGSFVPQNSSDKKSSLSGLPKSCKSCSHYNHSDRECNFGLGYGEPYIDCFGCSSYSD